MSKHAYDVIYEKAKSETIKQVLDILDKLESDKFRTGKYINSEILKQEINKL